MKTSGRPFAPVPARPDGEHSAVPEWLVSEVGTAPQEAAETPPSVPRGHVLPRAARPEPEAAAAIAQRSTPMVDRLVPALRRFQAPRRVWWRRAAVAGALVGSCAVLVSGIILTRGGGGVADSGTRADPVVARSFGGVMYLATFDPIPGTPSATPAPDQFATLPSQSPVFPSTPPVPSSDPPSTTTEPSDPPVQPTTEPPVDPPTEPPVDGDPLELPSLPLDLSEYGYPF